MGDLAPPPERGRADVLIWEIAERQHGVVGLAQLREIGLGRGAIEHRLATRRLHVIHPGAYAVGTRRLTWRGRWTGATLACGPDAWLSHTDAGALWRICARIGRPVHVTVVGRSRPRISGIAGHRVRALGPGDVAVEDGISVTSPTRTLLDLAEVLDCEALGRAFEAADREGRLSPRELRALCERSPGRRGLRPVLRLLDRHAPDPADVRGELERAFRDLCRRQRLPMPAFNVLVCGLLVDAHWPRQRLVVELDGYEFHRGREAFERDRARDVELRLAGLTVLRFTWRQLRDRPDAVADALRRAIASSTTSAIRSAGAG